MAEKDNKYTPKEKKAMRMVENYYLMIRGSLHPETREIPSQDKEEMYDYLLNEKQDSELIDKLYEWCCDFDNLRFRKSKISDEELKLNNDLFCLLGRPQLG